jgi:hypothetical protein
MSSVATQPAKKEPSAAVAERDAGAALAAIWWPSSAGDDGGGFAGQLTKIAVVEPPYCAP